MQTVFNGLSAVAFHSYKVAMDQTLKDSAAAADTPATHSEQLKILIRNYFERNELDESVKVEDVTEVNVDRHF